MSQGVSRGNASILASECGCCTVNVLAIKAKSERVAAGVKPSLNSSVQVNEATKTIGQHTIFITDYRDRVRNPSREKNASAASRSLHGRIAVNR